MPGVSVYLSYARQDAVLAHQLKGHLVSLQRANLITLLEETIPTDTAWQPILANNIKKARLIILLISPDFIASNYHYSIEMQLALDRQQTGEAQVIPVLLRPAYWIKMPFGDIPILPTGGRPIVQWLNRDAAFLNVVEEIEKIVTQLNQQTLVEPLITETTPEKVISALPQSVQDALRLGEIDLLQKELQAFFMKNAGKKLVIKDDDAILYFDDVEKITYLWQIWEMIVNLTTQQERGGVLLLLFRELLRNIASTLEVAINTEVTETPSSLFPSAFLDTQSLFANLNMPRQLPIIFYIGRSFSEKQQNELHQLLMTFIPDQRVAILLLFIEVKYFRESLQALRHFQQSYAYDIIPLFRNDLLKITEAHDSKKAFRQWLFSQRDLTSISPFITSGPTFKDMFFGREQELHNIQTHASTTSFALIGGRRIGKTSIMKRLELFALPEMGIQPYFLDCSLAKTSAELLRTIGDFWFPSPPPALPSFTSVLRLLPDTKPVVFLLDEADKLVGPDKAEGYPLINSFRALANAGRCQFIFSGEYAFGNDMHNPHSPLYNFANELLIGRLDPRAARELIIQPLQDLEIDFEDKDALVKRIWDVTSGHPNLIQRFCDKLLKRINRRLRLLLTLRDVEAVATDTDFLINDFLEIYWEKASILERLCTLIMVKYPEHHTLRGIYETLVSLGLSLTPDDVNEALVRLVNLRYLLRHTTQGYMFAVTDFPKIMAETYELDDLLSLTTYKYTVGEGKSQSTA